MSAALLAIPALAAPAMATPGDVTLYPLPAANAGPFGVTSGPDGNVWVAEQHINKVAKIRPDGTVVAEYPTTNGPKFITGGPDGNLWFTEQEGPGAIGRVSPIGHVKEFLIPTHFNRPYAIASGPDGNVWFTEDGNKIGRITMLGKITEFPIPTPKALPDRITPGPDGNMWFSEGRVDKLGRITPNGAITEFNLPPGSSPSGIVTGPDGHLWITEQSGPPGKIARIDRIGDRLHLTQFPLSEPGSMPFVITNGPDGALWFTDVGADSAVGKIGRITTAGVVTFFDSQAGRANSLIDIAAGPGDGKMWYGLYWTGQIASITTR